MAFQRGLIGRLTNDTISHVITVFATVTLTAFQKCQLIMTILGLFDFQTLFW